jgi:hypothetical protein
MIGVTTTSGYTTFFDYLNFGLIITACLVNGRAALRGPLAERARLYCTTLLAAFYLAAYAALLWAPISVQEWSNIVRGFGWMAWGVVWIWPALNLQRFTKEANRRLTSQTVHNSDGPDDE